MSRPALAKRAGGCYDRHTCPAAYHGGVVRSALVLGTLMQAVLLPVYYSDRLFSLDLFHLGQLCFYCSKPN